MVVEATFASGNSSPTLQNWRPALSVMLLPQSCCFSPHPLHAAILISM